MNCFPCFHTKKKEILSDLSQIKLKEPNERISKNTNKEKNINFINININQNINGLNFDNKFIFNER
jgi:hypothetical protein